MKLAQETTNKIIELKELGFSSREIARLLNVGKSTVNDLYARYQQQRQIIPDKVLDRPKGQGPKILVLDVETAAAEVLTFGRFKQNIGQDNVLKEGGWLLCASWLWLGEDQVESIWLDPKQVAAADDSDIILMMHQLLSQADAIIAHNGANFDWKMIQTRSVKHGYGALPYVKII